MVGYRDIKTGTAVILSITMAMTAIQTTKSVIARR